MLISLLWIHVHLCIGICAYVYEHNEQRPYEYNIKDGTVIAAAAALSRIFSQSVNCARDSRNVGSRCGRCDGMILEQFSWNNFQFRTFDEKSSKKKYNSKKEKHIYMHNIFRQTCYTNILKNRYIVKNRTIFEFC